MELRQRVDLFLAKSYHSTPHHNYATQQDYLDLLQHASVGAVGSS